MKEIKRVSPVILKGTPVKTKNRDNWEIVMEYKGEGDGPFLIDLTHKQRFDFQDSNLEGQKPFQLTIPEIIGQSVLDKEILINRMNNTQVSIYNFGEENIAMPEDTGFTDVTEATLFIALVGKEIFPICEKLTSLDFMNPAKKVPFLFQGPFSHVPCQIVTLSKDPENPGLVLTCSRGYGRDMIHAVLDAGKEFELKPAGEERFNNFINDL
ncbi:MAG: sarcosine oxidase subunit gamma SoxG [Thermodesulfobacteriota bacterium]